MSGVLILGATSSIAHAFAQDRAAQGDAIFLVGRNEAELHRNAEDLCTRGASSAHTCTGDLTDLDNAGDVIRRAHEHLGKIDIALIAHGTLSDGERQIGDGAYAHTEMMTNAVSPVVLMSEIAGYFKDQDNGTLIVISSVAGDRGRWSNFLYGAAKSAVTTFASGLSARFQGSKVTIITVKPGPVNSPMTADLEPSFIWTTPEKVAALINHAITVRKQTIYVPGYWRWIMLVIRFLPNVIFNRLHS